MNVALVGLGVEGKASYEYYLSKGAQITLFDENPAATAPAGAKLVCGANALDQLKNMSFDKVVRTPSLPPSKLAGVNHVTSATNEFLSLCPAPVIGVTGTKGKGTTASLIHSILQAAGKTSWLVGNIGTPALGVLDQIGRDDVVVYEMSSFQLWDATVSPHIAVVLMIEADHLDVHKDFDDYIHAKSNIAAHQIADDVVVHHATNQYSKVIAGRSLAKKTMYAASPGVHVENDSFYFGEQKLCSVSSLLIPGKHNQDNACAAIAAAWEYVSDPAVIAKGLSTFKGLSHRLTFIREVSGIKFYDDSIATTPGSAQAAIEAFDEQKVIILGGSDKGADMSKLYTDIVTSVKHVIAIGSQADAIEAALHQLGYTEITNLGITTMPEIVSTAKSIALKGDVVIMSPAFASFDMFKSYADRGEQFVAAVMQLAD